MTCLRYEPGDHSPAERPLKSFELEWLPLRSICDDAAGQGELAVVAMDHVADLVFGPIVNALRRDEPAADVCFGSTAKLRLRPETDVVLAAAMSQSGRVNGSLKTIAASSGPTT